MKLHRVKPDDIVVPEVRVTAEFDEEMWEQFKGSLAAVGQIAPIICIEVEGKLTLVDGLHRLMELRNAGQKYVDVAVIPGDEIDVYTRNLFLDHLRGKPPVTQMIKVIKLLTDEYHLDSEQIAERTFKSRDYVEKLQKLSQLTPACLAALDEGKIGVGQAAELTRLPDPIKQEAVLWQLLQYGWKTKELHDYVSDVLAQIGELPEVAPEQPPPPPPVIRCAFCRREVDITEVANPNICRECSLVLITSIKQAEAELARDQEPPKDAAGG